MSELLPCPFCGAGDTDIVESGKMWLGMKYSEPSSVSVRHHCPPTPGQPSRMIERVGRDRASAITAWNRRAAVQAAQPEAVGWKLVPVEPTRDMINAGQCGCMDNDVTVCVWKAMLASAQPPEPMSAPTAEPALKWCQSCGEGVTTFCRGKGSPDWDYKCPMLLATPPSAATPEPATDKLADRALAKSFRENPREASLADQAGMRRAINDPLTNRAFNMDGCATPEPSDAERQVLAYLDDLKDDAAAHIWPDDLDRCQTSECVVQVASVRMGSPDGTTVPLFSRDQVAEAFRATKGGKL